MNYVRDFLYNQPKSLDDSAMLPAGGHNINTGCVDAAMAQNICQLRYILFDTIESSSKQFTQIVGEYLAGIYPSFLA